MSKPARRFSATAVVFVLTGALLGGYFGGAAQADPERPEDLLWTFGDILARIEDNYVGDKPSSEVVEEAVAGMLRTLDPHSNYLNAESFGEMRDEQRGRFYGLGIQITKRGADKPLTIIAPIDDTPASRAGLQSGDIISHIEGEPTLELTVQQAVRRLKGDRGTEVTVTIVRPGTDDPFEVTLERDEIPIESIRVAYMLDERTGFIRLANFTSTTAEELDRAIEALSEQGMERLMLDLRGNPGGLLDQAVKVSERFIDSDKLIVYTRGRIPGSNEDYMSKGGVDRIDFPLIVLVDNSSASASEIVSGAVQDHDRGLVVGETTFGKGLVQRVIPLSNGGALAVTTAKYYTPSGRLIQRDYTDLDEYYLTRAEVPETADVPDGGRAVEDREVFHTASGRKVFGGGGIYPDHVVESQEVPGLLLRLLRDNLLFDYAVLWSNRHAELERDFALTPEDVAGFRAFLAEREFDFAGESFDTHRDAIVHRLQSQIARVRWDQVEESRVLARQDPQIQAALALFEEAKRLAELGAETPLGSPESDLRALARSVGSDAADASESVEGAGDTR